MLSRSYWKGRSGFPGLFSVDVGLWLAQPWWETVLETKQHPQQWWFSCAWSRKSGFFTMVCEGHTTSWNKKEIQAGRNEKSFPQKGSISMEQRPRKSVCLWQWVVQHPDYAKPWAAWSDPVAELALRLQTSPRDFPVSLNFLVVLETSKILFLQLQTAVLSQEPKFLDSCSIKNRWIFRTS